ncbi:MAG: hypothetical protein WBB19_03345 [Desulforhopalus sp.]
MGQLGAFYLKTIEQMERTPANESVHYWTLGHLSDRYELCHFFGDRAPYLYFYYKVRGAEPIANFANAYSIDWHHCDKVLFAEGYRDHIKDLEKSPWL